MALLTLVRHGQASFMQDDYDKLSALGERQSTILGEYWLRTRAGIDQVYYGPAKRHVHTGELVAEVFRKAGERFPDPLPAPELDEYPGIEVFRMFLPGLMEKHEDIRALEKSFREAGEKSDSAARLYDRLFQRITRMWAGGELDSPEVESWVQFCARIDAGIARIRANVGANRRITVFTSGGVIAATVRMALDLSPQRTLELSWTPRNASYTEFLTSGERFSLSSFNSHPHLEDPALLTYR
ncbi:MAG TPA: histidine phosphatase family protein [Bryobacteraceae bacterium]|nr:histidine phosphatase family protein [Bryobacteraceae bacterium]